MDSSSRLFIILFLVILCLWSSPFVRCEYHNTTKFTQPDCLIVPVKEFVPSVKSAINEVEKVTSFLSKFTTEISRDSMASGSISDCLDLLDLSAVELGWTLSASLNAHGTNVTTGNLSSDLRTWLSSVLVNQGTCLDGFADHGDKKSSIKSFLESRLDKITSSVTATLRMIRPISSHPSSGFKGTKLTYSKDRADAVVALDGTGDFTSINAAVDAAPDCSSEPFVIYVKKGVYNEYVEINKNKWNIVMIGDGMDATIITGNRNVRDGYTCSKSATLGVKGRGFIGQYMTFENTAGPEKHQAVAFLSDSDLSVLYRCGVRGYQDTLYAHKNRQFYKECVITGTVDFIFGQASAVFQDCQIIARKGLPGQVNTITAQGRRSLSESSGFSIQFSNITAFPEVTDSNTQTYFGRPWKEYSMTVIMESEVGSAISPRGWYEWDGDFSLNTLFYGEYMNSGAGADVSHRVNWPGFHVIEDAAMANQFTVDGFIAGESWLPATGIEYTGGLQR